MCEEGAGTVGFFRQSGQGVLLEQIWLGKLGMGSSANVIIGWVRHGPLRINGTGVGKFKSFLYALLRKESAAYKGLGWDEPRIMKSSRLATVSLPALWAPLKIASFLLLKKVPYCVGRTIKQGRTSPQVNAGSLDLVPGPGCQLFPTGRLVRRRGALQPFPLVRPERQDVFWL